MAKAKQLFFCQECGFESAKWMGQCPGCKAWNTFVEEKVVTGAKKHTARAVTSAPASILEVTTGEETRIGTGMKELDRVLGGGIVKGSLILIGGDPGIGKSTLLLQVCRNLTSNGHKVLYVSGEESLQQIKMRAERLGEFQKDMYLHCETDLDVIASAMERVAPEVMVVDSIQTMMLEEVSNAAGSVSQVREVTNRLLQIAKQNNIAIFIVGHVTKEGTVAGPRTLEHMVDTVLYFEGERSSNYRILRGVKNRFGATNELGVFEMKNNGLFEVKNPSEVMLEGRPVDAAGSTVVCSMEGTRPLLIEIQALVAQTNFQMPRRTTVGMDFNRVNLLMAVLEKRAGIHLGTCDAYVNLTGGIRLSEPAIDLGIVLALVSSYRNRPVDEHTIIFGEVGLTGEVRGVNMAEQRVKEAAKLGFTTCILPASNAANIRDIKGMKLIGVSNVKEAIDLI
ncbi:MAG: DNA repair protein RadA [Lachnospiraceae bacterium]|nr:DNA repair protein RadA [Lachnospiraceae bacterium]MBP3506072.1 DNA repair protein RadA [Lachnospiraceae bacterium]